MASAFGPRLSTRDRPGMATALGPAPPVAADLAEFAAGIGEHFRPGDSLPGEPLKGDDSGRVTSYHHAGKGAWVSTERPLGIAEGMALVLEGMKPMGLGAGSLSLPSAAPLRKRLARRRQIALNRSRGAR